MERQLQSDDTGQGQLTDSKVHVHIGCQLLCCAPHMLSRLKWRWCSDSDVAFPRRMGLTLQRHFPVQAAFSFPVGLVNMIFGLGGDDGS